MRKLLGKATSLLTALLLVVSLASCAMPQKEGTTRVKCPACGYEFDTPVE